MLNEEGMTEHDHYTLPNESMGLCNHQVITSQRETAAPRPVYTSPQKYTTPIVPPTPKKEPDSEQASRRSNYQLTGNTRYRGTS